MTVDITVYNCIRTDERIMYEKLTHVAALRQKRYRRLYLSPVSPGHIIETANYSVQCIEHCLTFLLISTVFPEIQATNYPTRGNQVSDSGNQLSELGKKILLFRHSIIHVGH